MNNPHNRRLHSGANGINWRGIAASPWSIGLAALCLLAAIVQVSLQRTVLGIGAESDFAGVFGREAQRILLGEPLELHYHPPGYSFVVALGHVLTGDWLNAGLWISGISALALLATSIATYRKLAGTAASWGALLACACSMPFLVYASVASSDMMFAALVYLLLAFVVLALAKPDRVMIWAGCGAAAACVLLTRTNGLAAAAVLLLPFLVPGHVAGRARNLAAVSVGFFLPLLAWVAYALHTGSPMQPVRSYLNIAVLAYGDPSGTWSEQMNRFQATMHSMSDVLAYDPGRLVRRVASNLVQMPIRAARSLTWPPLALLAVPGVVIMLIRHRTPALLACFFLIGGITAVSSIPDFISRFHLILVPLIGAMAGVTFAWVLDRFGAGLVTRSLLAATAFVAVGFLGASEYAKVLPRLERPVQREFAEAIPYILRQTESDATLVARNPNLSFETGRRRLYVPEVGTASELFRAMCRDLDRTHPAYLHLGEREQHHRSDLVQDLAALEVSWLEPVARGTLTAWTLYRIRLDRADCDSGEAAPVSD